MSSINKIPQDKMMTFLNSLVEEEFITADSLEDKDILNTLITKFTSCLLKAGFNKPANVNSSSVDPASTSGLKLKMSRSPRSSPVEVPKKKKAMNGYLLFNKVATAIYVSNGIKAPFDHLSTLWKDLSDDVHKEFNNAVVGMDSENPVISDELMSSLSKFIVLRPKLIKLEAIPLALTV